MEDIKFYILDKLQEINEDNPYDDKHYTKGCIDTLTDIYREICKTECKEQTK